MRDLNIKIAQFPGNIIASIFNFTKMEFFDLVDDDIAQKTSKLNFNN